MHIMNERDYKLFEQIVKMSQPTLKRVMAKWLKEKYQQVVETKDYIYAIGDIPVALAAHMDTVFSKPVESLYYDTRKNVMWSPEGLGADDRAGIFAIYQIVRSGLRPHIILSTDEEKGCVGATELAKLPCPFEKLNYIIQLDRRGSNDCVFYDCDNGKFTEYVESFGFIEAIGSFTDITEYCPAWGVAGVNLSVGYYNEHTYSETLCVNILYATIHKVKNMLMEKEIPYFEFIQAVYPYGTGHYWGSSWETSLGANLEGNSYQIVSCSHCGEKEFLEDMYPVIGLNGEEKMYCHNCISDRGIEWCDICYRAVEIDPSQHRGKRFICNNCNSIRGEKK